MRLRDIGWLNEEHWKNKTRRRERKNNEKLDRRLTGKKRLKRQEKLLRTLKYLKI